MNVKEDPSSYEALVRAMARGEHAALGTFYDRTLGQAHAVAVRIVQDRDAAEDVLAETYLQIWRDAARYDPARGNPLAWLLTICRSRALDALRRQGPLETRDPVSLTESMVDSAADTADIVTAMQEGSRVRAALAALPEVARQLLTLAFFRGLSHQEIAAHTGLPLGTVKSHLRKAQEALRERLEIS